MSDPEDEPTVPLADVPAGIRPLMMRPRLVGGQWYSAWEHGRNICLSAEDAAILTAELERRDNAQ